MRTNTGKIRGARRGAVLAALMFLAAALAAQSAQKNDTAQETKSAAASPAAAEKNARDGDENAADARDNDAVQGESGAAQNADGEELNPRTGFPKIKEKPYIIFDEGAAFSLITRVEKNDTRSNFVWQNDLIGAYFGIQTVNMRPVNSMIRVSAFYPFYYTFDGMRQYPTQTLLYAFDLFAGPVFRTDMWKYVRLNFSAGLHYMYQLTDEYHLHYLGGALLAGVELPLSRRWTILLDGLFALDYPNLGTNRNIQPFDYAWQYQLRLGVRYSKKNENKYSYIHSRSKVRPEREKRAKKSSERNAAESGTAPASDDNGNAAPAPDGGAESAQSAAAGRENPSAE